MIRKIMATVLCVMFLSTATAAFAEDVFTTKRGKKYHAADCRFVKNRDTQEISKKEAIEKGLKPCGRCYKEDLASNAADKSNKNKTEKLSKVDKNKNSSVR